MRRIKYARAYGALCAVGLTLELLFVGPLHFWGSGWARRVSLDRVGLQFDSRAPHRPLATFNAYLASSIDLGR